MSDRDLCKAACRAVGIEPEEYWSVSNDGGMSMCASSMSGRGWRNKAELTEFLAEKHARGFLADYEIVFMERWPQVDADARACAVLKAAAVKKGLGHPTVIMLEGEEGFVATLGWESLSMGPPDSSKWVTGKTEEQAVARAYAGLSAGGAEA